MVAYTGIYSLQKNFNPITLPITVLNLSNGNGGQYVEAILNALEDGMPAYYFILMEGNKNGFNNNGNGIFDGKCYFANSISLNRKRKNIGGANFKNIEFSLDIPPGFVNGLKYAQHGFPQTTAIAYAQNGASNGFVKKNKHPVSSSLNGALFDFLLKSKADRTFPFFLVKPGNGNQMDVIDLYLETEKIFKAFARMAAVMVDEILKKADSMEKLMVEINV